MANYKEMYLSLFRDVTNAIELLQKAQVKTEEMFISFDNVPPIHLSSSDASTNNKEKD